MPYKIEKSMGFEIDFCGIGKCKIPGKYSLLILFSDYCSGL